ncbi:MAG: sigma-70 family RNA polymerase sigma factor [Planctomycetota bacterium]
MKSQPTVAAYIASVVWDRHHVEDLVQEVATVVAEKVDLYEPERPFLPWALGIARNLILKYMQRRSRDPLVFDGDLLGDLAQAHIRLADGAKSRKAALHECVGRLTSQRKDLIEKRYFRGIGIKPLARELGRSEAAVSMLLLRIRQSLARCIRERLAAQAEGGG